MTTDKHRLDINNWFEENIIYEGEGYAEFSNPKGWVSGYAKVTFDATGNQKAYLDIREWECEHGATDFEYTWLITGVKPTPILSGFMSGSKLKNSCLIFKIITHNGYFEVLSKIGYTHLNTDIQIKFSFSKSQYISNNHKDASYWVMPLTNFIADCLKNSNIKKHELDNHPLRIFIPPQLKDEDESIEMGDEIRNLRIRNYFIEFGFGKPLGKLEDTSLNFEDALASVGISPDEYKPYDLWVDKNNDFLRWGFIEILSNYDEKAQILSSSQSKYQITSLMVGCYKNMPKNLEFDETMKHLPTHFSLLLSFASGSYVGVPWIELRASNGRLVSRLHTSISWEQLPYQKGIISLDQSRGWGITNLLTNAPLKIEQNLREAIRLAIKVRHYNYLTYLSDIMADLFRAFDTLSQSYGAIKHNFEKEINPSSYQEIQKIIHKAYEDILVIGNQTNGQEKDFINGKIANDRVKNALNPKNPDEADSIINMVTALGLKDIDIIPDRTKWRNDINRYRNQVIHDVYFDFDIPIQNQSLSEAGTYLVHLYDLLIRIILKMLNYDGIYKSYLKDGIVLVDWVQPTTTPPSDLGYK